MTWRQTELTAWSTILEHPSRLAVHFRSMGHIGTVFRRLTTPLIVWLGLLSVIAPAVTCAAAVSQGDCCPSKAPAPCGECPDKRAPSIRTQPHCVTAPVQAIATSAMSQSAAENGIHPGSADATIVFDLPSLAMQPRAAIAGCSGSAAHFASCAAFTYLVTGRLRL